jgi:hypothetical protein
MKLRSAFLFAACASVALCGPAKSAQQFCGVKVSSIIVSPNGTLYPSFEGLGTPVLCSLNAVMTPNATIGPITADVCKLWYAALTTAMTTQTNITLAFDFGAAPVKTCAEIAANFSWQIPDPYPYFMQFDR